MGAFINRADAIDHGVVAKKGPPPDPIAQQRIEQMTIDKNNIGKPRSGRLEDTAGYLRLLLCARDMSDGGMAAIDHGCGTGVDADPGPEVPFSYSNIIHQLALEIQTAAAEQSNKVRRSVVPQTRRSPTPVLQATPSPPSAGPSELPGYLPFFAGGLSRESDEPAEYLHRAALVY
jgi:hypothetical protein